jgi:hypothetical protein
MSRPTPLRRSSCRVAVLGALVVVLCAGRPAQGLNINAYQLLERPLPSDPRFGADQRVWMNALRFTGSPTIIPLSRTRTWDDGVQMGFAPRSLRITWLDPGRLLHVQWGTLPHDGSSWAKCEGHIVLLVDGTRLRELVRDVDLAYWRAGMGNYDSSHLRITYDAASRTLRLIKTVMGSNYERDREPDEWHHRTVWQYHVHSGQLLLLRADRYAVLADESCSLQEAAEILDEPAPKLRRLNARFTPRAPCLVRIDDRVGRFVAAREDGVEG